MARSAKEKCIKDIYVVSHLNENINITKKIELSPLEAFHLPLPTGEGIGERPLFFFNFFVPFHYFFVTLHEILTHRNEQTENEPHASRRYMPSLRP